MTSPQAKQRLPQFVLHHLTLLGTGFVLLFIVQTGLVPYDFTLDTSGRLLFGAIVNRLTTPDIILNILLYVPLGYLGRNLLYGRIPYAGLIAVAVSFALSAGIEYAQFYLPARVSSRIDLVANVSGALVGVVLAPIFSWILPRLFGALLFELRGRPGLVLVQAYVFFLALAAALPFALTIDTPRLKQAVEHANLKPFSNPHAVFGFMDDETLHKSSLAAEFRRWDGLKRYARWSAEFVSFAVLAIMLECLLLWDYRFSANSARVLTLWLITMLAAGFSMLQFFIMTRGFDITDVICRLAGGVAGQVFVLMRLWSTEDAARGWMRRNWAGICGTSVVAVAGYVTYTGVIPLAFDVAPSTALASLQSWSVLPFFGYQQSRLDVMVDDLLGKTFLYVLLGLFLAAWHGRNRKADRDSFVPGRVETPGMTRVMLSCIALAALTELCQLVSQVRVASLTDPVIAAAGSVLGVTFYHHAVHFYWYAHEHRMYGPESDEEAHQLSPLDELVASLADPYPQAPKEGDPDGRKVKRPPTRRL